MSKGNENKTLLFVHVRLLRRQKKYNTLKQSLLRKRQIFRTEKLISHISYAFDPTPGQGTTIAKPDSRYLYFPSLLLGLAPQRAVTYCRCCGSPQVIPLSLYTLHFSNGPNSGPMWPLGRDQRVYLCPLPPFLSLSCQRSLLTEYMGVDSRFSHHLPYNLSG
jgi:hypothetical protein